MRPSAPPARVRLRQVANAVNLSTALGLGLAVAGRAGVRPGPSGLLLAEHYRWGFPTGSAFTVGDVVISRDEFVPLLARHPGLLAHEEVHARQWMWCCGLPFIPLYLASMGLSWLRTGDRASGCLFERQAGLARGGYTEAPARPLAPALRQAVRGLRAAVSRARRGRTSPA